MQSFFSYQAHPPPPPPQSFESQSVIWFPFPFPMSYLDFLPNPLAPSVISVIVSANGPFSCDFSPEHSHFLLRLRLFCMGHVQKLGDHSWEVLYSACSRMIHNVYFLLFLPDVWCLCIYVLFHDCVGVVFLDWLENEFMHNFIMRNVLICAFAYGGVWLSWGDFVRLTGH